MKGCEIMATMDELIRGYKGSGAADAARKQVEDFWINRPGRSADDD